MVKKAIILPIGKSPAVATEIIRYLEPEGITDVVLIPTSDDFVIAGSRLVEAAVKVNYPKIRIHISIASVRDVTTEKDTLEVMKSIAKSICKEKFKFGVDRLYLSISGGRKEITVTATILGLAFGITGIYHVVNKDIGTFNDYQEIIKKEIKKFIEPELSKRIKMYQNQKYTLDRLLFPPGNKLEFIKVPVIPYPPEHISLLKRILRPSGITIEEENIDVVTLEMLRRAELVMFNEYRVWPTDLGIKIGKMLRCEL